jgi:uncharacterized protein (TIGR00255 family)
MTGYGHGSSTVDGTTLSVELKAVNHRYLEIRTHLPPVLAALDTRLLSLLQKRLSRGRVEATVRIDASTQALSSVRVDTALAQQYQQGFEALATALGLPVKIDMATLANMRDVLICEPAQSVQQGALSALEHAVDNAIQAFLLMRRSEGQALSIDLQSRFDKLSALLVSVETHVPILRQQTHDKLLTRVRELLESLGSMPSQFDDARVLTEVALIADRSDISEELTRAHAHLDAMKKLLASEEDVGRKLDFLCQELLREFNTTGSKVADADTRAIVVDLKAELERVREQVQNLE